jgi:hypothetical protein
MDKNAFTVKEEKPTDEMVSAKLLSNYSLLEEIRQHIEETIGETREEWKYYGKKLGWTLKTFHKKRNLFFISVYEGYFKISFVFGERAFQAAMDSELSAGLKSELEGARNYAEGRGISIQVDGPQQMEDIRKCLHIKIEN